MEWPKRKISTTNNPASGLSEQSSLFVERKNEWQLALAICIFCFGCIWITVPRKVNQCSVISRSVVGGLGYRRSTTRLTSRPVHHRLPNRCFSWSGTIRYSFSMTFWVDPFFFSRLLEPTPSPPSLVFVDAILRVSASSYSFH